MKTLPSLRPKPITCTCRLISFAAFQVELLDAQYTHKIARLNIAMNYTLFVHKLKAVDLVEE